MRKTNLPVLACLAGILLLSCKKKDSLNPVDTDLLGNWTFLQLHAKTSEVVEATDGIDTEKTVSLSEYFTKNNAGTLTIDAGNMSLTGFEYTIDTTFEAFYYINGGLIGSFELPLSATIPPSNSSSPFKQVGSDYLYFPSGGFVNMGSGNLPTTPGGAKYKIVGDILTLTAPFHSKTSETVSGVTTTTTRDALVESTYKKQ